MLYRNSESCGNATEKLFVIESHGVNPSKLFTHFLILAVVTYATNVSLLRLLSVMAKNEKNE